MIAERDGDIAARVYNVPLYVVLTQVDVYVQVMLQYKFEKN